MIGKVTKILLIAVFVTGLVVFGILATSANAQQMPSQNRVHFGPGPVQLPGVFGKVTAISGTTLTVVGGRMNATTTYSINASGATVLKNGSSTSLSSVSIGDMVMVQGTITGDSVVATKIMDGFGDMMHGGYPFNGSGTRPFNASDTRGYFGGRPSGTPPFASGTFPGGYFHNFPTSTASSTNPQPHHGFFGSIANFFGGLFGHFRF